MNDDVESPGLAADGLNPISAITAKGYALG